MNRVLLGLIPLLIFSTVFSVAASAGDIPVGILSFDDPNGPTSGQFDITNLTGSNSMLGFPITTALTFTITDLNVKFVTGPPIDLHSGDFTSDLFGGWNGNNSFTSPILSAELVGTLSPTSGIVESGVVGTEAILADFEDGFGNPNVNLSDPAGPLGFGDLAVIYASTTSLTPAPPPVPEPETGVLLGTALAGLIAFRFLIDRGKTRPNFA